MPDYTAPVPIPGRNMGRADARVEARDKVTGRLAYAADTPIANLAHAFLVTSTIAKGRVRGFDLAEAKAVPGLLELFTHENMPSAQPPRPAPSLAQGGRPQEPSPLSSPNIMHDGQIIGVVVAETYEIARDAARRVRVDYEGQPPAAGIESRGTDIVALAAVDRTHTDPKAGDFARAFAEAAVTLEADYSTPAQHHNAIELFTTIAAWNGDDLRLYDATQHMHLLRTSTARALGIDPARVTIINPFVGGSFGGKNPTTRTAIIAAIARVLRRPVKLVTPRNQGFTTNTYRAETRHKVKLGAERSGKLVAYSHDGLELTSRIQDYRVGGLEVTTQMYAIPNIASTLRLARADRNTPGYMRAPPEIPYMFALEAAMDEMAEKCGLDPVEFRRLNDTMVSPVSGKAYTSRSLVECYAAAAAQFGWARRDPRPGSMRRGDWLVGYGCATSARAVQVGASNARVRLSADGAVLVQIAAHDPGTGATTIMAQVAAETLRVPIGKVSVQMGDTRLPQATNAAGSRTTATAGSAVKAACDKIVSRFGDAMPTGAALGDAFRRLGAGTIEEYVEWAPPGTPAIGSTGGGPPSRDRPLAYAFGAQFVEVNIHSRTREIRVPRLTGAYAAGRIMNPRTARSQLMGAAIWGIAAALHEATEVDEKRAKYVNDNIAEYLIPVNADIREIEIIMVPEVDDKIPMGIKGLGELGNIGVNAAISNAVYHATGKRIRDLPIRIDNLID